MSSSLAVPGGLQGLFQRRKYELLLCGLLQHLFIAAFLTDLGFYARCVWPLNMVILGGLSVEIFAGRGRIHRALKNLMLCLVVVFPALAATRAPTPAFMLTLSLCYVVFFLFIFVEVLRYLLRPSYINADIVSASICGFLLLLETGIFAVQAQVYAIPNAFKGLSTESFTATYLDIVYFCSITITSIGFGDITPNHHMAKLATAMLGIVGQFYSVVLVGILIAKYTSASEMGSS